MQYIRKILRIDADAPEEEPSTTVITNVTVQPASEITIMKKDIKELDARVRYVEQKMHTSGGT